MLSKFFSIQFLKFILIGMVNTLSGVAIASVLSFIFNANLSFIIGYIIGLLISYILNSVFTFKEPLSAGKFLKFTISYVPNFIIQNIIVYLVYNVLGFYQMIAYLIAAIIGLPITFLLMKYIAFKEAKLSD